MNIIILSNQDIASNYALNLLLPKIKKHTIKLFLSSKVGNQKQIPNQLKQLQYFEQTLINQFLFPLVEQQQKPSSSNLKTFNQLEYLLQLPWQNLSDVNAEEFISESLNFNTDLIISIRFGLILKDAIIATSKHGVINLHSGLLPQYQGVMPTFRAMLNGETTIGSCLHYIENQEIDSGEIIASTAMPISKQHSYLWHVLKLYQAGCDNIADSVQKINKQQPIHSKKAEGKAEYFSFPTELELENFQNQGFKLFDTDEVTEFTAQYLNK